MTCSLCETGLNFRCHIISPQTPSGQILGESEENYFLSPNKIICVWGISRGKLIFVDPLEHRNLCLGISSCELISASPPNIEIGVRGDLKPILPLTILHFKS